MLRFSCRKCGQKMKVPLEYAGRKARCKGCNEPLRVPKPEEDPVEAGPALGLSDLDGSSGGDLSLSDLAAMEERAVTGPVEHTGSTRLPDGAIECPSCGAVCSDNAALCVQCGHSFTSGKKLKTKRESKAGNVAKAAAGSAGKATLGLVLAGVTAIVFAVIWVGVIFVTGYEVGFLAWLMGLAVGFVTAAVARTQSPAVGMAAAGIAFGGWLTAKLAIYGLIVLAGVGADILVDGLDVTEAEIKEMAQDDEWVFEAVAEQMYEEQTFSPEVNAWTNEQEYTTDEREERLAEQYEQEVTDRMAQMSQEERVKAMRGYWSNDTEVDPELIELQDELDAELERGIWIAFSPFDLLWVFLMVGSAYKVGSGGA